MDKKEILENLCYYDKRNPNCTADDETISDHKSSLERDSKKRGYEVKCACDNCFYGRTKLANELLRITELLNKIP